jgi:hypothetical protein
MRLTAKKDQFARLIVGGSKQVDAYRQAYGCEKSNNATVRRNASRLLKDPEVRDLIESIRIEAAAEAGITVEESLKKLADLGIAAQEKGNMGAAVRAEELRGKIAGLYVEKREDITNQISDEEIARSIAGNDPACYEIVLALATGEPMDARRIAAIAARHLEQKPEEVTA